MKFRKPTIPEYKIQIHRWLFNWVNEMKLNQEIKKMEKLLNNEYRNRMFLFHFGFVFLSLKRHKYINSIFILCQRWSSYCYLTKIEIYI